MLSVAIGLSDVLDGVGSRNPTPERATVERRGLAGHGEGVNPASASVRAQSSPTAFSTTTVPTTTAK